MTLDSNEIIDCMAKLQEERQPFVLATVVRTEELTAAKAGAKAVILPDGSIIGWVGGGCTLGAVKKAAAEAFRTGKSKLIHIKPAALAEAAPPVAGVDVHKSGCPSGGTEEVFIEPILPQPALIILGASSAALVLCDLGRRLGFWVTIAAPAADLAGVALVFWVVAAADLGVAEDARAYYEELRRATASVPGILDALVEAGFEWSRSGESRYGARSLRTADTLSARNERPSSDDVSAASSACARPRIGAPTAPIARALRNPRRLAHLSFVRVLPGMPFSRPP